VLDVTQRKDVKAFIECQKKFDCVNLIMNNADFTLLSLMKALKVDDGTE
jgi:NADP-dependent 3-hydroxy acid dehydrogenase YdfG